MFGDSMSGVAAGAVRTGEVAVLGCGMCSPQASAAAEGLEALRTGIPAPVGSPQLFTDSELAAASGLPHREVRKLDRFSLLAVAAARRALETAGLEPARWRSCGVLTGNVFAGWTFTEPELRALHRGGAPAVSPYLATAWFPAAPQGQITIQLGLTGFAKTLTTDRCAGAQALGLAYERILQGRDPLLLAGGVEAPRTPLVETARALAREDRAPLGEAAAYAVLAPWEGRGAAIAAWASVAARDVTAPGELAGLLEEVSALGGASRPLAGVWVDADPDEEIEAACRQALAASPLTSGAPAYFPGRLFGETLAAGAALSLVLAVESLVTAAAASSVVLISMSRSTIELFWLTRAASAAAAG